MPSRSFPEKIHEMNGSCIREGKLNRTTFVFEDAGVVKNTVGVLKGVPK